MLLPVKTEPADVILDGVDVLHVFLGRVCVIKSEVTSAAVLFGQPEVQTDTLDVSDVKVTVRLRRESGDDGVVGEPVVREVILNDLLDEVERTLFLSLCFFHINLPCPFRGAPGCALWQYVSRIWVLWE